MAKKVLTKIIEQEYFEVDGKAFAFKPGVKKFIVPEFGMKTIEEVMEMPDVLAELAKSALSLTGSDLVEQIQVEAEIPNSDPPPA